jgi:hypothetical protein
VDKVVTHREWGSAGKAVGAVPSLPERPALVVQCCSTSVQCCSTSSAVLYH